MALSSRLKTLLFVIVVFAAVWIGVIVYWRSTYRIPDAADIGLWMVVLPLGVVFGALLARAGLTRWRRPSASVAAADPTVDAPATARPREQPWLLGAASVRLASGSDAGSVLAAAAAQTRAGLHPRLRDPRGMPVFAAASADADAALDDSSDDGTNTALAESARRALQLASDALVELLESQPPPMDADAVPSRPPAPSTCDLLLPSRWPEASRAAALGWLRHRLGASGLPVPQLQVVAVDGPVAALQHLDALRPVAGVISSPHYVLACDSAIDEEQVAALSAAQRLMTGDRQEGLVPGEGACALWFDVQQHPVPAAPAPTSPGTAAATATAAHGAMHPGPAPAIAALGRLRVARRERSANMPGRSDHVALRALMETSTADGADIAPPAWIVSDTDQRASRQAELAGALAATLPALDPIGDHAALGLANGDTGAVAALAAIALAAARVRDGTAGLVVSVAEAEQRALLPIAPPPPIKEAAA